MIDPLYAALLGIVALLIITILVLCAMWRSERRDLYDRIMCGSMVEYQIATDDKRPGGKQTAEIHKRAVRKWKDGDKRIW